MNKHEFNKAFLDVMLHTKQNWPNSRLPRLNPETNTELKIPPAEHKVRIFGNRDMDDSYFIHGGVNDLTAVMNIAELYHFTGGVVMDWGVGCGRMIRHLHHSLKKDCIGVDIDWTNITWCETNLPFGQYHDIEPFGKLPCKNRTVDLIYSHSVLTHLCETAQVHWLQELNRVLKGVAVLSVHGLYSTAVEASWSRIPKETKRWLESGFKDSRTNNPDISDVAPDLYYKDIAHTPKYIYEVWSKYIRVVDIIPGGFGHLHDAVVCFPI